MRREATPCRKWLEELGMFGLEKAPGDGNPAFPCLKGFPGEEARRASPAGP